MTEIANTIRVPTITETALKGLVANTNSTTQFLHSLNLHLLFTGESCSQEEGETLCKLVEEIHRAILICSTILNREIENSKRETE